ncbi:MAG: hypothetical protein Ct9H90mP3_0870 [Flammeovirgaceae bacterium]|nr:MAG: hypothetical protein Ct9H90mP3_0870 [Flammeovirgaceae bacterium]
MKEFSNGQSGKCPFTSGQIKFSSVKEPKIMIGGLIN